MEIEAIRLGETIAARLTTTENNMFSGLVRKFNTTKSELIRKLIIDYIERNKKK